LSGIGAGWLFWGQEPAETAATPTTIAGGPATASTLPAQDEPVADVAAALLPTVVQIQSSAGLGSGVIYDPDGLILTAAHVVGGDQQVSIRLADGDQLTGAVVGTDPNSDIAVISIDQTGLTAAPLAHDSQLEVGQTAVALGSPYGLEQTVTAGVVSATDRAMVGSDGLVRTAIQTDAPINPGNSGGPLADLQGQVIGINDAIFSQSGGNEGVGFAVPITIAKQVADQLVAGEPIETAFLGISGTEPTQGQAGVLVTGVYPGSPAGTAGILVGDLITAVDEQRVESMVDLAAEVRTHQPGDEVVIHLSRGDQELDLDVTLGSNG
jgi:putative serine protease PepD